MARPEILMSKTKLQKKLGVAGIISLLSLLSAWVGISFLLDGNLPLTFSFAAAAFIFDSLDGYVARKLNTSSEFGRQLDGMIDAINYSLFAALTTWRILMPNMLGICVGFVILTTGILRLINFNHEGYLKKGKTLYYRGIVTCHLSLITGLLVILTHSITLNHWIIAAILTIFALLQLSNIPTRKTHALFFWIPVSIIIVVGAWLWL
jgi:CDP-diacylglycerol--serine O-phosphatidyltransferase